MNCDPGFMQPTPPIGNTQIEYSNNHIPIDLIYSDLLMRVLEEGQEHNDRTGVGTLSLFNVNMTWEFPKVSKVVPTDVKDRGKSFEYSAIPLLTGKKIHTKSMLVELVWFLRAETTLDYLHRHNVSIWDEWADEHGQLGPVYGSQWRRWRVPPENQDAEKGVYDTVDQIFNLVDGIRNNPNSRRHMLVGYNPGVVHQQALPACHAMAQFSVRPETRELDLIVYQRSADAFLGVPFNIASYAMLQWLIGMATGYRCGKLHFNFGDFHIYSNHLAQVHKYLRNVRKEIFCTPIIGFDTTNIHGQVYSFTEPAMLDLFNKVTSTTSPENAINFGYENFSMQEYESHPVISAPVAV